MIPASDCRMKLAAARHFRRKIRRWFHLENAPKPVRRVIIGVIGGTILLIGIAMIILPGPAIVVVPLGLAVLATEYIWARRWLKKLRTMIRQARNKVSSLPAAGQRSPPRSADDAVASQNNSEPG